MKQFFTSFFSLSLVLALVAHQSAYADNCCNNDCSLSSMSNSCDSSCDNSCDTSCSSDCISTCSVSMCKGSGFIPRSAHANSAYFFYPVRKYCSNEEWSGYADLGFEYQRSFSGRSLAKCLFGSQQLHFQGSQVANRDPNALIAENFGLSQVCDATAKFNPRIQNYNLHFLGHLGWDSWMEGLYSQLNFTFSHQRRSLFADGQCSPCDGITTSSICGGNFPAGYMSDGQTSSVADLKTALQGQTLFGDMQTKWAFGKFAFCEQTENKVAGVSLILGYNPWCEDCGHFGFFIKYVAPTGNKLSPDYIFSPVIGNGKHHELHGGISVHYELWNDDEEQSLALHFDGSAGTMFKNCQVRSFDFKGKGCLSRYMLLKELTPNANTAIAFDYAGNLINGINFATRQVNVKVDVVGDASLRLVYANSGFNVGVGYNIYGQSREKLCNLNKTSSPTNCQGTVGVDTTKHYGFKGCTGTRYYQYTAAGTTPATTGLSTTVPVVLLNATASNATITTCATTDNAVSPTTPLPGGAGVAVDWTQAVRATGAFQANAVPNGTLVTNLNQVLVSGPAAEVTTDALDIDSARAPRQLTHKGFATLDYTWIDCDWSPYVGIGAEVEGGSRNCDLKQWGVWLKGGISY